MTSRSKNKHETKQRIVRAVGQLIAEQGFSRCGVNAIARKAGVDKVLIYRYFDGLDGLYTAYARSADFWPSVSEILGEGDDYAKLRDQPFEKVIASVFRRYTNAIRSRPLTLEILAWETIERNSLTIALEEVREQMGLELMSHLQTIDTPPADWQAISIIFTGAIHYLAIRGRKIKYFSGLDLSQEESWERLLNAIETIATIAPQTDQTNEP